MMKEQTPPLAALVQAGEQQTEAIRINDFIYMIKDVSNAYLVNTEAGDVLINAGFMGSAERNKALLKPVRSGPLKYIVLTQAHADHYGGVPELRETDTKIIAQQRFAETWQFFDRLEPYLKNRSAQIWSGTIKGRDKPVPHINPNTHINKRYDFTVGKRKFELISTPGGESPDALVVWLPKDKVVFTGNLFGPVFLSMPNLCTLRGDKPRSARLWLKDLALVRDLNAELLITGHGEPIRGRDHIRQCLDKMHAAVSFVLEQTLDGMNAGKDVHTLMAEIRLPEEIAIGELHGKVSWAVRTIWEEHSGWFHMDSTTALYSVARTSIDADLVELAGGAEKLAARAQDKLTAGQALEALHLLEVALGAEPDCIQALKVKQAVIEELLKRSGGTNMSEVMWLKNQLGQIEATLANQP